ncbi:MAG: HEAT repeat domain-containing protein, partial [Planctomycetota bacterium]
MQRYRTVLFLTTVAALSFFANGLADAMTVYEAIEKLATHKFGQNNEALALLLESAVSSHSDPALRKKLNDGLVRILDSNAAYDAKQFACRQLALTATEEHIPALARHLGDEKMTHIALYVLTHIDSPKVDKALLVALETSAGNARLGIMNMLGNHRCPDAVEPLGKLMISGDEETSIAAIRALGRIGTESAHRQFGQYDIVYDPPRKRSHAMTMTFAHANLDFADWFLADGKTEQARRRYRFAFDKHNPAHIRAAGLKGLVVTMGEQAGPFVARSFRSGNKDLYGMAATIVRTVPKKKTAETLVADLPELEPNVQVLLIGALAARGDGTALTILKDACGNDSTAVRNAALSALGKTGDETCIPLLINHAGRGAGEQRDAALESLVSLRGEKVNASLVERLRKGDNAEKAVVCRALLQRNADEAAPALVKAMEVVNPSVRAEALKALRSLAGQEEMPALVDLIFVVEPDEADEVGKALAAVASRNSMHRQCTENILARHDGAKN